MHLKHGLYFAGKTHKVVAAYNSMLSRCYRPSDASYKYYGAKGIRVCKRWRFGRKNRTGRECFIKDMGFPPTPHHTLERRNRNRPYSPGNCRWATHREQAQNRSNNHLVTFLGKTQTMSQWARDAGLTDGGLYARLRSGIPFEEAVTTPKKTNKPVLSKRYARWN